MAPVRDRIEERDESAGREAVRVEQPPPTHVTSLLAMQRGAGNAAVAGFLARDKTKTAQQTPEEQAKASLKQSLQGKNASAIQAKLIKRFPKGPLFTPAEEQDIITLSGSDAGKKWLKEVGIGPHGDALAYLTAGSFKDWLKLAPGKRLLAATIAFTRDIGKDDEQPNPAYTLGRAMAIQNGIGTDDLEDERDEHIRNAFINTLKPVTNAQANTVNAQPGVNANDALQRNAQAQHILTRVLFILHAGLQVFDGTKHVDYNDGDVVRALAHGGRVNIRIPALTGTNKKDNAYALTNWIGITNAGQRETGVTKRGFGTHHMKIGENKHGPGSGTFEEEGGKGASMANKTAKGVHLYGVDLAAGGIGKTDFNGDVILPDGAHGHMFIGFTKPTKTTDGALQIGIETTAPGADSLVGYKHDWNSTEATANPESSFFGHKMQKIGKGKLKHNQRLVDLNKLQANGAHWWTVLEDIRTDWEQLVHDAHAAQMDDLPYEQLVGPRQY